MLSGVAFIRVDSNTLTIFREDQPIRQAFELVDRTLAGTGNLEIVVDTGVIDGHKDPAVLRAIDELQHRLEGDLPDIVRKTISLVNVTKDSFRALNEGRDEMYVIPDDARVLAETLVLFDGANPVDRRLLVSDDYQISRIMTSTRTLSSEETVGFMAEVEQLAETHLGPLRGRYPELSVSLTGQIPLFLKMMSDMSWSQIKSFAVTLAIISTILLFVLGSLRLGLVSIIPNLLPVVTVLGVMGLLDIPLDLHTLLVLPIVIGISVDDTIHLLTHIRLEQARGADLEAAIRNAMSEAGQAILFTSVILAVGYLIFLISVNKGFGYFGTLSSIAIATACLSDLVLLPALLRLAYRR
jgi:predicted RND superfamily exporter protein